MKIGFITVHRVKNYGSALLCFATQALFQEHGFEVEFIDYVRMTPGEANTCKDYFYGLKKLYGGNMMKSSIRFLLRLPHIIRVRHAFLPFRTKYLNVSSIAYRDNEQLLKDRLPQADIYCTGGDQMWNEQYNFHKTLKPLYLDFAPEKAVRISFSTSIGKTAYDRWEVPEVLPLLAKYQMISVREESAVRTLTDLGLKNVTHIQDPTFLLASEIWRDLAAPRVENEPYLLVYGIRLEKPFVDAVSAFAKKINRKVVTISNCNTRLIVKRGQYLLPEPEIFLSLIRYADYVITDSFHGTVFSIKFKKQFVSVFSVNSTRIASILSVCGLESRRWMTTKELEVQLMQSINYGHVDEIWARERAKADAWIEQVKRLPR